MNLSSRKWILQTTKVFAWYCNLKHHANILEGRCVKVAREETALSSAARKSPWQPSHSPPPKGNHQASGCLEKRGTVDQRPWYHPYAKK